MYETVSYNLKHPLAKVYQIEIIVLTLVNVGSSEVKLSIWYFGGLPYIIIDDLFLEYNNLNTFHLWTGGYTDDQDTWYWGEGQTFVPWNVDKGQPDTNAINTRIALWKPKVDTDLFGDTEYSRYIAFCEQTIPVNYMEEGKITSMADMYGAWHVGE